MDEDWGAVSTNRPTFSLFDQRSPEEEAKKNSFVDIVVYNRWSKAERRLYQRLRTENIVKQLEQDQLKSVDDIVNSLNSLNIFKSNNSNLGDSKIDDLISTLEGMRIKASSDTKVKMMES